MTSFRCSYWKFLIDFRHSSSISFNVDLEQVKYLLGLVFFTIQRLKLWNSRSEFWFLFFWFLSNRPFWVVLEWKTLQELSGNTCGDMVPFLVLLILLDDVICNVFTYIDDTNLYSKCDWAFLLLGFSSNLLLKCLVDFKGEKTKLCLLLVRKTLVLLIWKQLHLSLIKKYLLSFFYS